MLSIKMKKGLFLLLFLAILILPSVIAANCGDIITQNTNLSNDLYNCPNRGLEIGADNIVLDCNNYVINGTFSGPSAGHGIFLQGYSNVTIKNCQINNFLNGLFIDNSNGGILKNNNLDYNIRSGAYLRNSNNYEITNNSFIYNGDRNFINGYDSGIYVKDYSANNLIKNNYFFDNTNGIILESISSENYIEDNYIDRSPKNGILLRGNIGSNSNVSIEDNTILRNENGINLTYVRYVDLKNNIISNHSLTGIWSISSMDVFIENNSLINNNYGLFFHQQGSGNIFYHNNFISNIQSFYSTGLENITLDFNGEGN